MIIKQYREHSIDLAAGVFNHHQYADNTLLLDTMDDQFAFGPYLVSTFAAKVYRFNDLTAKYRIREIAALHVVLVKMVALQRAVEAHKGSDADLKGEDHFFGIQDTLQLARGGFDQLFRSLGGELHFAVAHLVDTGARMGPYRQAQHQYPKQALVVQSLLHCCVLFFCTVSISRDRHPAIFFLFNLNHLFPKLKTLNLAAGYLYCYRYNICHFFILHPNMYKKIIPVLALWGLCSCGNNETATSESPAQPETTSPAVSTTPSAPAALIPFTVKATHPHDTTLFIEGFLIHDGKVYESTGSPDNIPFTRSLVGILNLKTCKLDEKIELDRNIYFGEGIVLLNNKIYQLTYQNQKGFIYDATTFKKTGEFSYANKEGWGFTTDGQKLIMSDGSATLTFLNPDNQQVTGTLTVKENGNPVNNLNELEYIKGFIYANIWLTNFIVKIDPATGNIVGKLNMNDLSKDAHTQYRNAQEMNGIAYDAATDKIYVTGKMWPTIYEVAFEH